jgi:amidophosphoribosyltransferase
MEDAVAAALDKLEGAYSLVIASPSKLIAARDPHGFRPLCMGRCPDGSVVFASESCALDAVGAVFDRDLEPGEVVTADAGGVRSDRSHCGQTARSLCVFEYIYFARPDSVLDGTSVCLARQRAGELLSAAHPVEADVVIGVPDSGLDAAIGYARASGIPYALGFTKNKYVGRTFIAPTQGEREAAVNVKLNPIRAVVEGKRIILIDDSIVRGTTCRHIIALLRAAFCGALLLRHRHRHRGKPDRQPSYSGGDRAYHRRGFPGLPVHGGRCSAHRPGCGLLYRLLRRGLPYRCARRRPEGPL